MKCVAERTADINRKTAETDIKLTLNIDGSGKSNVDTGCGFLDHMLTLFARHGRFDLDITCKGDTYVDDHHTTEDIGIVLGDALAEALGDKKGITRYGSCILPMDETLCLCALDLSGRPYLNFDMKFTTDRVGEYDTEMVKEFFYAVSYSAKMNLHLKQLDGTNNHHLIEAAYKSFARALDAATKVDDRIQGVLSAKGAL